MKSKPRILYITDHSVPTGFSRVAMALAKQLKDDIELTVIAINWRGDPRPDYGYPVWPATSLHSDDTLGQGTMMELCKRFTFDAIWVQLDAYNVVPYEFPKGIPIIADTVIDGEHHAYAAALNNKIAHLVTQTEWGLAELRKGGYTGPATVIPYGIDHDTFYPRGREMMRFRHFGQVPIDAFIFGNADRNNCYRKMQGQQLSFFADWLRRERIDNAYLHLHCNQRTDMYGVNLEQLATYFGVNHRVIFTYRNPEIDAAISPDTLAEMMSAWDVTWSTSTGEGWGLAHCEAMACGAAGLLPKHSAYAEWAQDHAWLYKADELQVNRHVGVLNRMPNRSSCLEGLTVLYRQPQTLKKLQLWALARTDELSWVRSADLYSTVFTQVLATQKTTI